MTVRWTTARITIILRTGASHVRDGPAVVLLSRGWLRLPLLLVLLLLMIISLLLLLVWLLLLIL